MIIDKVKTCAFTGHRVLSADFNKEELTRVVKGLIAGGYNTFLVGMALGFDTECFKLLEKLRQEQNIKIVACIPCLNQDKNFTVAQKEQYKKMLAAADERIYISKEYTKNCMFKRNMFMVDSASILVAYLNNSVGGTYQTVNYAKRKGIEIIKINK